MFFKMILFITAITTMKYVGINFTRNILEDLSKWKDVCDFLTMEEYFVRLSISSKLLYKSNAT